MTKNTTCAIGFTICEAFIFSVTTPKGQKEKPGLTIINRLKVRKLSVSRIICTIETQIRLIEMSKF